MKGLKQQKLKPESVDADIIGYLRNVSAFVHLEEQMALAADEDTVGPVQDDWLLLSQGEQLVPLLHVAIILACQLCDVWDTIRKLRLMASVHLLGTDWCYMPLFRHPVGCHCLDFRASLRFS